MKEKYGKVLFIPFFKTICLRFRKLLLGNYIQRLYLSGDLLDLVVLVLPDIKVGLQQVIEGEEPEDKLQVGQHPSLIYNKQLETIITRLY